MKLDPTSPEAWLLRARSNLRRAILGPQHPEVVLEDLVFDAQQAAEKALKAVGSLVPKLRLGNPVGKLQLPGRPG